MKLQPEAIQTRSTDEVYGSLAYEGAPLLRIHLCISRAFIVILCQTFNILHLVVKRHSNRLKCPFSNPTQTLLCIQHVNKRALKNKRTFKKLTHMRKSNLFYLLNSVEEKFQYNIKLQLFTIKQIQVSKL